MTAPTRVAPTRVAPTRVAPRVWLPLLAAVVALVLFPLLGVSLEQTLLRAAPFLLAGLATAVPARAGLVNVGGEGQLVFGMIFATGGVLVLGEALPAVVLLPLLAVLGMAGGLLWAAVPALLRQLAQVNETISTLLLNFVAILVLAYLVYGPWKDPDGFNLPMTVEFPAAARLPTVGSLVHVGVLAALVVAVLVWLALDRSRWGFRLGVVGRNPEAARRGGLSVTGYQVAALLIGGALAGLAGMLEVSGVEGRLRPEVAVGFGYIGFLASWLVGHRPPALVAASLVLAGIFIGGDSLQIELGLPSAAVFVVMAVVVLVALAVRGGRPRREMEQ